MNLPADLNLNIAGLSRLFDNKSECYKLFWFQAILTYVCNGQLELCYEDLIDEMIADAWYMVTEYHLNLGPNDTLEKTVNYISSVTGMLPATKKQDILDWLKSYSDPTVLRYKRILSLNVPYRLQAPLLSGFKGDDWKCSTKNLAEKINQQERLIYYFICDSGLKSHIRIDDVWAAYLLNNQEILRGWIQYNIIIYLQRRNPSVPGISDKLYPPQERKLEKVKKYWKLLTGIEEIHEIYGEGLLLPNDISIDHFVPWSYVAHDEFWNLHPTTRSINSSKSNNLPDWNLYFPRFAALEFESYKMIWTYAKVHDEFEKCAREHLNNSEIKHRLYQEGLSQTEFKNQLESVVYPVWQSAKTCGFKNWEYAV